MKRTIFFLFTAVITVVILIACGFLSEDTANLTLYLGGTGNTREGNTPSDEILALLDYEIYINGPTKITLKSKGSDPVKTKVISGTYTISVKAFLNNELFAEGYAADVDIKQGRENSVPLVIARIPYTVYIAGSLTPESEGPDWNYKACYWKNGILTVLHNSSDSAVNGIAVADGTVYAAGWYEDISNEKACYWVNNGPPINLNVLADTVYSNANAIAVADGNVYIAGFCQNSSGNSKACYWINNGSPIELSVPAGEYSEAKAITVVDDHVYILGYYSNWPFGSYTCYWKDEGIMDIDGYNCNAIAVVDGNVYISGAYEEDGIINVCYWENGIRKKLPNPGTYAEGLSIAAANGKVYTAGYYSDNSGEYACYWVNGSGPSKLTHPSTVSAKASAIAIGGDRLYIAGLHYDESGNGRACYWVNGIMTYLPSQAGYSAYASSIAIVPE